MSERPTTEPDGRADVAVVVPIKSFVEAKGRLSASLSPGERADLARDMAAGVIRAAAPLPVWVVCHDHDVARWAMGEGARVMWLSRPGLNSAVSAADRFLHRTGVTRIVVAHGDLPLARELEWVADGAGVTIVPDRRGEGTNVLALPTGAGFVFGYGEGSAARHRAEAERLGLAVRIVTDADLGWDVDTPEDLDVFGPQEVQ
ncbi:MAG: 2-phospho-L-lactate guanylyltransferase [Actinomycetota bacterium]